MNIKQGAGMLFQPLSNPEDWRQLLAKPDKHWKTGYSAKALAYCWQEANGFPPEIKRIFRNSSMKIFQDVKMLVAFPKAKGLQRLTYMHIYKL